MVRALGASAMPPHFSGSTSSTTSSLRMQSPRVLASSTDHIGLAIQSDPSPITWNSVAGFSEGDRDEPAKKKVRCVRYLDTTNILTQTCVLGRQASSIHLTARLCGLGENGLAGTEMDSSYLKFYLIIRYRMSSHTCIHAC